MAIKRIVSVQSGPDATPVETPVISVPHADTTILEDDILILVGSDEAISNLPQD